MSVAGGGRVGHNVEGRGGYEVRDDCLVAAPRVVITHDSSSLGAFLLLAINFQQPLFPLFLFFLLEQAADSSPDRYLDLTPAYQAPSLLCFFISPCSFYAACSLITPPPELFFYLLFSLLLVQQEATCTFSPLLIISSFLN